MRACFAMAVMFVGQLVGLGAPDARYVPRRAGNFHFPVYTNQPLGRQLSGGHAAAATQALSPAQSQQRFAVPPGFEVRLFASEPEVVNPVAMTWDDRGRLWVLELYEYPKGAPRGQPGRDRIKILEDRDADGRADTVSVFADGLNLATGLLLGHGGVFVGQAPDLLFLQDTNGDDRADRRTVLKTGFGLQDRHELLNSFAWGPDGWLYMTHGVFTHSKVRDPKRPEDDGVTMNAALARYHPRTRRFEVFADGTSNPWGVDFDADGQAFVCACVIPHLFHLAPGGIYQRQSGQPTFQYAYGLLPSIVNFRHYRAAHAGIQIYQGNQYPAAWQGLVFLGNIHQSALNLDRLEPVGCTFKAVKESTLLGPSRGDWQVGAGNFLVANDPWFRPVSVQTGPDGALWVMDWYDRYPCYQNAMADPNGVDREFGRIWRVVWVGDQVKRPVPSRPRVDMDLSRLNSAELVALLKHPNSWHRRAARRLLTERREAQTRNALVTLLRQGPTRPARLAAFWTLHGAGLLDDQILDWAAEDRAAPLRRWAARLTAERGQWDEADWRRLQALAQDHEVTVRAGVATALRLARSGSLTVDTPSRVPAERLADCTAAYTALLQRTTVAGDPLYGHLLWMMLEPVVSRDYDAGFRLIDQAARQLTAASSATMVALTRKLIRRLCDERNPVARQAALNRAVRFLDQHATRPQTALDLALTKAALAALLEAFQSKGAPPTAPIGPTFQKLHAIPDLAELAQRLGMVWGDAAAAEAVLRIINSPQASTQQRLRAIETARQIKSDQAQAALLTLIGANEDDALVLAALRALSAFGSPKAAEVVIDRWRQFPNRTRRSAAELLVTRAVWARALLAAIEVNRVSRDDISASALRALSRSRDAKVKELTAKIIGRIQAADKDKLKLIAAKKKVVLTGQPDLVAGHELARKICLVCHSLHGEGADVGPDLTGVGRGNLDTLLANVIDPNQIIGQGYENVEVETKDGRTLSGRLVENTDTRVVLLSQGPKKEIIPKADLAVGGDKNELQIRVSEFSVMPEGLEQLPDADFRNLIWYLLNPPQDHRPLTPQLYRELTGETPPKSP